MAIGGISNYIFDNFADLIKDSSDQKLNLSEITISDNSTQNDSTIESTSENYCVESSVKTVIEQSDLINLLSQRIINEANIQKAPQFQSTRQRLQHKRAAQKNDANMELLVKLILDPAEQQKEEYLTTVGLAAVSLVASSLATGSLKDTDTKVAKMLKESVNKIPLEVKEIESKKQMDQMIAEEDKKKTRSAKRRKARPRHRGKSNQQPTQSTPAHPEVTTVTVPTGKESIRKSLRSTSQTAPLQPTITNTTNNEIDIRLTKLALNLFQRQYRAYEHPRVQRWATEKVHMIRNFADYRDKQQIFHYKQLSSEAILEQRARHFLPGVERLLKEPYRSLYTFPTNRGYGVNAQLEYKGVKQEGHVYFGIKEDQIVFHKYFESAEVEDCHDMVQEAECEKIEETTQSNWLSSNNNFQLEISKEGVLQFIFSDDHQIFIYPCDSEGLKENLTNS